jgi:amino acid transporter
MAALVAGASLLTDYILTVAVSISSGVAQIVSAFPHLEPYRVAMAVAIIGFVTLINLRGVKESGSFSPFPHLPSSASWPSPWGWPSIAISPER